MAVSKCSECKKNAHLLKCPACNRTACQTCFQRGVGTTCSCGKARLVKV